MTDTSLFASRGELPLKWLDTGSLSCPAREIISGKSVFSCEDAAQQVLMSASVCLSVCLSVCGQVEFHSLL